MAKILLPAIVNAPTELGEARRAFLFHAIVPRAGLPWAGPRAVCDDLVSAESTRRDLDVWCPSDGPHRRLEAILVVLEPKEEKDA